MSKLAHHVFFQLTDRSPQAIASLVDACHKYLDDHPGVEYFAVGTRTPDLVRPVNDQVFDVSLHVVFATRADHDAYQTAPRHLQFIEEQRGNWASVRVCDSDLHTTG
jgi:hypothetical protein